jgi:methionyl-tRNA formyltransferase
VHFAVEAVITKPRPAHHHGDVPVLDVARELELDLYTANNQAELDQLFANSSLKSRLGVLIDFGIIVSQKVIDHFPLGIINSHFSILPEWRGADPITFAILSGQKQTGVSLMLLVEAMDEGPILAYGEYDLPPAITTPELTTHLIKLSDALLRDTLPRYLAGQSEGVPQKITGRKVSYSRKLTKHDGAIDWHKPAAQLEREIRAFIEWPRSRATVGGKEVIVTKSHVERSGGGIPGQISVKDHEIGVSCGAGTLMIERLKPAGKSEMTAAAFLAGYGKNL